VSIRVQRYSRTRVTAYSMTGLLLALASCNNSRYGVNYDRRLPQLKRIALAPSSIVVQSLHTGGVPEARPDMVGPARDRTLDCLATVLIEKKNDYFVIRAAPASQSTETRLAPPQALVSAVQDAILTHHYVYGNERTFEYSVGGAVLADMAANSADAVLWVSLTGIVPTEGREALKATAIVVGVLTGIWVFVPTDEAVITLMLVDVEEGDVLWFNRFAARKDVRDKDDIEDLVNGVSKYMLEPRE